MGSDGHDEPGALDCDIAPKKICVAQIYAGRYGMCVPQFAQFRFDLIAFDPASQRHCGYIELARTSPDVSERCRMIEVKRTREGDPLEFEVIVRVGGGKTRHHVTMARDTCERLTAGRHTPARCIEAAFQFLLDREPKESILRHFDVTVISHYFPEFERELPRYLSQP